MEKHEKIEKSRTSRLKLMVGAIFVGLACGGAVIYTKRLDDGAPAASGSGGGGGGVRVKKHAFDQAPIVKERLTKQKIAIDSGGTERNVAVGAQQQQQQQQKGPPPPVQFETELALIVEKLDEQVREVKKQVDDANGFMETDPKGVAISEKLQDATRQLLKARYGPREPYRVQLDLTFQETMPDYQEKGPKGRLVFQMAPTELIPHSVFTFLEIARQWKKGAFHRRANHVLQVMVQQNPVKRLAFQEYSPKFPHAKGTVGYAGRPSGPAWYISIQDNTRNHGPGSQQERNPHEADAAIGTVIEGFQDVVLERITKMPGQGFINDPKKHVLIDKMTILVPTEGGGYEEWKPNQ